MYAVPFRDGLLLRQVNGSLPLIDIPSFLSYSVCLKQERGAIMKSMPDSSPDKEIVKAFEAGGVVDYLEYLQSGKRVFWVNFNKPLVSNHSIY